MRLSRGGKTSERVRTPAQPQHAAAREIDTAASEQTVANRPSFAPSPHRAVTPRLSPREAERQGEAVRMALNKLREPGAATAFLNSAHDGLGGRPLDLAIASDEGLRLVAAELAGK